MKVWELIKALKKLQADADVMGVDDSIHRWAELGMVGDEERGELALLYLEKMESRLPSVSRRSRR